MKTLLLFSGGLDSTVLLWKLLNDDVDVHCLSFHYGQNALAEIERAKQIATHAAVEHEILDITGVFRKSWLTGDGSDVVVPNRNQVFLSIAVSRAISLDCRRVAIGCNRDDWELFLDCRPGFIDLMRQISYSTLNQHVAIIAPYNHLSKRQIIEEGMRLKAPLDATWSCYGRGTTPCGECEACRLRLGAFEAYRADMDPCP